MDFKNKLVENQKIINEEIKKVVKNDDSYEARLNEAIKYSLLTNGKRIRAILVLETYKLFKDDYQNCMTFAIGIEMLHNFSLIHDDLPEIDNDDFRHGKPTNHKAFDHATALLAGDGLFNYAYYIMSNKIRESTENEDWNQVKNEVRALNEITIALDRMVAGEYLDTELENKDISIELLKYIHKNKTGALLNACAKVGAILAGVSEKDIDNLSNYAKKIGLAFQIKDDILSVEGDEKILGKPVGNDEKNNKNTYVSHYGLEQAKKELEMITQEAVDCLVIYGEKAEFLKQLALYIKDRNR